MVMAEGVGTMGGECEFAANPKSNAQAKQADIRHVPMWVFGDSFGWKEPAGLFWRQIMNNIEDKYE